jgi:hypothetical protein
MGADSSGRAPGQDPDRNRRNLRQVLTAYLTGPPKIFACGHAFVHNLRRGFYEPAHDVSPQLRLATAFTELAQPL